MEGKSLIKIIALTLVAGMLLSTTAIASDVKEVNVISSTTQSASLSDSFISLNPEGIKFDSYTLPKGTTQLTPFYTNKTSRALTYSGDFVIEQKGDKNIWKQVISVSDSKDLFTLAAGASTKETIALPSQLSPGEYRFIKGLGSKEYVANFKISSLETTTKATVTLNRDSFPEGTQNLTLSITNSTASNSGYDFKHSIEKNENGSWINVTGNVSFHEIYAILPVGESADTEIKLSKPLVSGSYRLTKTVGSDKFVLPFEVTNSSNYPYLININVEKDSYPPKTNSINLIVDNATQTPFTLSEKYNSFQQKINNKWIEYNAFPEYHTNSFDNRVLAWKSKSIAVSLPAALPIGEYRMILSVEGEKAYLPITIK